MPDINFPDLPGIRNDAEEQKTEGVIRHECEIIQI